MVKTPITQAIAQIKIWKDINRLTDDDFEKAGFNEVIEILEGFLPDEKEVIENTDIIKRQDEIIGTLTREKAYLQDTVNRTNDWRNKAKIEFGYECAKSFDYLWNAIVKASEGTDFKERVSTILKNK